MHYNSPTSRCHCLTGKKHGTIRIIQDNHIILMLLHGTCHFWLLQALKWKHWPTWRLSDAKKINTFCQFFSYFLFKVNHGAFCSLINSIFNKVQGRNTCSWLICLFAVWKCYSLWFLWQHKGQPSLVQEQDGLTENCCSNVTEVLFFLIRKSYL